MQRFWDARAREDALYFVDTRQTYRHPDLEGFFAQGDADLENLLGLLGLAIAPSDVVVDIGCGVGRLSRALAARAARVLAIDVSAEMLARARDLNAGADNITWLQGDGLGLGPIADGGADACVSHVVFQHIPDPAVTLGYVRDMGRVLRPGGWAAFGFSNDPAVHTRAAPGRVRALLGRAPRGQGDARWRGAPVALDDVRAAAGDGGLEVERVSGEGTQYCFVCARRRGGNTRSDVVL